MKSFITLVTAAAGLLDLTNASPHFQALEARQFAASTLKGCYSSNGGAKLNATNNFNTDGSCQIACGNMGKPVMLLGAGKECWCGDLLPASSTKVDSSKCNFPCPGDGLNEKLRCGGLKNLWNVYNDGLLPVDPDEAPAPTSSASSSSATVAPTPTSGGNSPAATTILTTVPATTEPSEKKKSGPNVAAIAAGVVVGIVLLAAVGGGVFIYMRNQKRREIEEEHRRNAASSNNKPPVSAGSSFTDTRLDPVVMARRQSDGSIADNQDYSRRILKVTNA